MIECSLLGPAAITSHLVDLGAEVIKVEAPAGDYGRKMTWPLDRGHVAAAPAREPRQAVAGARTSSSPRRSRCSRSWCATSDVVIEAMRPGLPRQDGPRLRPAEGAQPEDRDVHDLGLRRHRPVPDLPSHGIAYDAWSGTIQPVVDDEGFAHIPDQANIGITAGPAFGAIGILAALVRAREDRRGRVHGDRAVRQLRVLRLVPHRDVEGLRRLSRRRRHRQPERRLRAPRPGPRRHVGGRPLPVLRVVRRPHPVHGVGAVVLEELLRGRRPRWTCSRSGRARRIADHARGNKELQAELRDIFRTRTSQEWIDFADEHNTTIAPANTAADRARTTRSSRTGSRGRRTTDARRRHAAVPAARRGRGAPGARRRRRRWASTPSRCCASVLGYDDAKLGKLKATGALG